MAAHFVGDTAVLTGRTMRHVTRSPDTIITTAIMPIAIMVLLGYVFGGAIRTGSVSYVNYMLPGIVRLYRLGSEILETDADDDSRLREAADILASLAEQAYNSGEINLDLAHDDLPFDLLDALVVESDPRGKRLLDLMRERGWARWTRPDRLAGPPG